MKKSKRRCANPLFEKWLMEWHEVAKARNHPDQRRYADALQSLRKCPLPLQTGKECIIVDNFWQKLCVMIDKKLVEHKKLIVCSEKSTDKNLQPEKSAICTVSEKDECSSGQSAIEAEKQKIKRNNKKKAAEGEIKTVDEVEMKIKKDTNLSTILRILYESRDSGCLTIKQLNTKVQQCKDSQFTKPNASNLMLITELMSCGLVKKILLPVRYHLTDYGLILATNLFTENADRQTEQTKEPQKKDEDIKELDKSGNLEDSFTRFCKENKESNPCVNQSRLSNVYGQVFNEMNNCAVVDLQDDLDDLEERFRGDCIGKVTEEHSKPKKAAPVKTKPQINVEANKKVDDVQNVQQVQQLQNIPDDYEPFVLEPNTFDVILLVDIHETNTKSEDQTAPRLQSFNTNFIVRHLNISDFTWIAQCRRTKRELVLPYAVERKRVDDLSSSIKDHRFHEQKFRLKRSGIENLIYLVEGLNKNSSTGIPISSLYQAATNSLVQDDFALKYTSDHKDSMMYLSTLTKALTNMFKNKRLISCKKSHLESKKSTEGTKYLMEFEEFNKSSTKMKNVKVQEMFTRQLAQLKGVSLDKAIAITKEYPTPVLLASAFSEGGENLLSGIKVGYGKQAVGPAISQTLHKLYTRTVLE